MSYTTKYQNVNGQRVVCLPAGLVDLFTDDRALNAGLNVRWVLALLANPLPSAATVNEWRDHFYSLKAETAKAA